MQLFFGAAFFLLGAVCASFAGLLAARLNTGTPIARGRSRCDACGKTLAPSALVPIASYLFSCGRARCCGARISFVSTLTELALGALFVLAFALLGLSLALVPFLAALVIITALVLYDLAHQILPPPLLTALLACALLYAALVAPSYASLAGTGAAAFAIALFLAALSFFSGGRAMGAADAPFAFALALLAGELAFSGIVYSFWIGAVIGIGVLLRRPGGPTMGIEVPFAPFLAAGFLLALFTGWNILTLIGF